MTKKEKKPARNTNKKSEKKFPKTRKAQKPELDTNDPRYRQRRDRPSETEREIQIEEISGQYGKTEDFF